MIRIRITHKRNPAAEAALSLAAIAQMADAIRREAQRSMGVAPFVESELEANRLKRAVDLLERAMDEMRMEVGDAD